MTSWYHFHYSFHSYENCIGLKEFETVNAVLPFFHIYGQVVIMLSGLLRGAQLVLHQKFDPEVFLTSIQQHQVNSQ